MEGYPDFLSRLNIFAMTGGAVTATEGISLALAIPGLYSSGSPHTLGLQLGVGSFCEPPCPCLCWPGGWRPPACSCFKAKLKDHFPKDTERRRLSATVFPCTHVGGCLR